MKLSPLTAAIINSIAIGGQTILGTSETLNPNLKIIIIALVAALQAFLTQMAFYRYPSGEKLFDGQSNNSSFKF